MNDDAFWNRQLQSLREKQLQRWQQGERLSVEELVRTLLDPAVELNAECLMDLIYSEVLLREEQGESPTAGEYCARFPLLSDAINRQFLLHAALLTANDTPQHFDTDLTCDSSESLQSSSALTSPLAKSLRPELPEYDLHEELGRGGMGVVYKAQHRPLKRAVALKFIRDGALADPAVQARFQREAEAVAKLEHPHIVKIYDCGQHNGLYFLSLEYVSGGNLESWTKPPLRTIHACAAMVEAVARGVGYAHQQQIVHRDLKPANILLAPCSSGDSHVAISHATASSSLEVDEYQPKITDFGLAKHFSDESNLTRSEAILGTGAYMSPEQAWGDSRAVGPATDIYALGVILYELLTGETPFHDASLIRTLDRVRFEEPQAPSRLRSEVPAVLDAICLKCLHKSPAQRYATAEELAEDLRRFLADEPLVTPDTTATPPHGSATGRRWRTLIGTSFILTLILSGMIWAITQRPRTTAIDKEDHNSQTPLTAAIPPPRTTPEAIAFLVGVRSYAFGEDRVELAYTESDVNEMSRLLLRRGFARKNIHLLTQWSEVDNPRLAPTAPNIRQQLKQLLGSCIPGDFVLIAITGLGGEAGAAGTYCYLPADAAIDRPESLLALPELYQLLEACPSERKLLIVDTCQTSSLDNVEFPIVNVPDGVAAFFACSPGESSYEHADLRHGVFSYHMMLGLEGSGDLDRDGNITIGELFSFASGGVKSFVGQHFSATAQNPELVTSLAPSTVILPLK
jgi:serine/threonine protein kinase